MRTIGPGDAGRMRACPARKPALFLVCSMLWGLAIVCGGPPVAKAATLLDNLLGSWSGSGRIGYDDGGSEGVRCTAFYTGSSESLRLAIRCRSDSTEVEISRPPDAAGRVAHRHLGGAHLQCLRRGQGAASRGTR